MKVERALHMAGGEGENSYTSNSRLTERDVMQTKPVLQKAIHGVCTLLSFPDRVVVVADLGCSAGPNTLQLVSDVMAMVSDHLEKAEVQFFLNDLPGNDFNLTFRLLEPLWNPTAAGEVAAAAATPLCFVAGLPGSFYTRLFPSRSVHLFHSSYALMWRSKVPEEISRGTYLNEGNIYIGKTAPPAIVKSFREQFQKDFSLFLALRSQELVSGGYMVLTFLGRKSAEMLTHGEVGSMWELLAQALQFLVQEGRVKEDDLTSFNLPYYAPSVDEVKALVEESELFDIEHIGLFESNWDRRGAGGSDGEAAAVDCARSGASISRGVRSVVEPLIADHFGASIVDELFLVFASILSGHLEKAKAEYPVILVSLKARPH